MTERARRTPTSVLTAPPTWTRRTSGTPPPSVPAAARTHTALGAHQDNPRVPAPLARGISRAGPSPVGRPSWSLMMMATATRPSVRRTAIRSDSTDRSKAVTVPSCSQEDSRVARCPEPLTAVRRPSASNQAQPCRSPIGAPSPPAPAEGSPTERMTLAEPCPRGRRSRLEADSA